MSQSNFLTNIQQLQDKYYDKNNGKNRIFKTKQKNECAEEVSQQVGLDTLLQYSVFILNDNEIHVDYTVLKTYISPSNYKSIIDYIIYVIKYTLDKYSSFSIIINLDTFTITAFERHRGIITQFCDSTIDCEFSPKLTKLVIRNSPSFIKTSIQTFGSLIPDNVYGKLSVLSKVKK